MVDEKLYAKYLQLWPSQDRINDVTSVNQSDNSLVEILQLVAGIIDQHKTETRSPILGGNLVEINYNELIANAAIPSKGESLEQVLQRFEELVIGHPFQTEFYMTNAIALPTKVSLAAMFLGAYLNSNPLWDIYGPAAAQAEVEVTSMISELIGFDKKISGGYFIYGGTGGQEAALSIGIEKVAPNSKANGVPNNIYVLSSDVRHFSVDSVVANSGIGTNKNIIVRSNNDNSMDISDLERKMRYIFAQGGEIAVIYATTGTTDSFGIDQVSEIKRVSHNLSKGFDKPYTPYIHADLAMGGLFPVFNNYDFQNNPIGVEEPALHDIKKIAERMSQLKDVDSLVLDFHKLGQTPKMCSLFMVKDAKDFTLVDRSKEASPYTGDREYGEYHTSWTKETSRLYSSIAALANLKSFGIEGYQVFLAHLVEMAVQLKRGLNKLEGVGVLNIDVPGPVAVFRFYSGGNSTSRELNGTVTKEEVEQTNAYMEFAMNELFGKNRNRIFFGDTKRYRHVDTLEGGRAPLYAIKAFIISPYTTSSTIEKTIEYVRSIRDIHK